MENPNPTTDKRYLPPGDRNKQIKKPIVMRKLLKAIKSLAEELSITKTAYFNE